MIQGIFRTKGINPENGRPNVIALMFDENQGISLDGGALGTGVRLSFGERQPFDPAQWLELSKDDYRALLESQEEGGRI